MKISSKKNTSSVEFTVEFDKNDLEPARIKALSRLARDVKIPGFRNGKAPANIVEQHVDPNQLASETLDIAVRTAIPKLFDGTDMLRSRNTFQARWQRLPSRPTLCQT